MSAAGRPVGQFNESKEKLYFLLKGLSNLGCCFATTSYLAKVTGRSTAQTDNYLRALREEGKIQIRTGKPLKDQETGAFYQKRVIKIIWPSGVKPSAVVTKPVETPTHPSSAFSLEAVVQSEIDTRLAAMKAEEEQIERAFQAALRSNVGYLHDNTP